MVEQVDSLQRSGSTSGSNSRGSGGTSRKSSDSGAMSYKFKGSSDSAGGGSGLYGGSSSSGSGDGVMGFQYTGPGGYGGETGSNGPAVMGYQFKGDDRTFGSSGNPKGEPVMMGPGGGEGGYVTMDDKKEGDKAKDTTEEKDKDKKDGAEKKDGDKTDKDKKDDGSLLDKAKKTFDKLKGQIGKVLDRLTKNTSEKRSTDWTATSGVTGKVGYANPGGITCYMEALAKAAGMGGGGRGGTSSDGPGGSGRDGGRRPWYDPRGWFGGGSGGSGSGSGWGNFFGPGGGFGGFGGFGNWGNFFGGRGGYPSMAGRGRRGGRGGYGPGPGGGGGRCPDGRCPTKPSDRGSGSKPDDKVTDVPKGDVRSLTDLLKRVEGKDVTLGQKPQHVLPKNLEGHSAEWSKDNKDPNTHFMLGTFAGWDGGSINFDKSCKTFDAIAKSMVGNGQFSSEHYSKVNNTTKPYEDFAKKIDDFLTKNPEKKVSALTYTSTHGNVYSKGDKRKDGQEGGGDGSTLGINESQYDRIMSRLKEKWGDRLVLGDIWDCCHAGGFLPARDRSTA